MWGWVKKYVSKYVQVKIGPSEKAWPSENVGLSEKVGPSEYKSAKFTFA